MQELAKQLRQFLALDGNRTAALIELIGKNAANAAPFLKQLAEMGELHTTVTNEQAAAAKRLEDQWTIMQSAGNSLKNATREHGRRSLGADDREVQPRARGGLGMGRCVAPASSRDGAEDSAHYSSQYVA
jgi:hypothetical protein